MVATRSKPAEATRVRGTSTRSRCFRFGDVSKRFVSSRHDTTAIDAFRLTSIPASSSASLDRRDAASPRCSTSSPARSPDQRRDAVRRRADPRRRLRPRRRVSGRRPVSMAERPGERGVRPEHEGRARQGTPRAGRPHARTREPSQVREGVRARTVRRDEAARAARPRARCRAADAAHGRAVRRARRADARRVAGRTSRRSGCAPARRFSSLRTTSARLRCSPTACSS